MKYAFTAISLFFVSLFAAANDTDLPSNFYLSTLDNGLQLLIIEDSSVPLVTIELAVHNGSFTETPDFNGLSHLYEHMFFKANEDLPNQEAFLDRVHELGIVFNGTTGTERVNYYFTMGSQKLSEGLDFMHSAITGPLFLESEIKNEDPVVDGEFQRNESNPVFWLLRDMGKLMWGDLFSRKNPIGEHDIILSATAEKMHEIQNRYYYPNNSILVVAGDVQHERVKKLVEKKYSNWERSTFDIFEKYPIPEFAPLAESKSVVTTNEHTRVPIIAVGFHGPDTRHDIEATYPADVFSYILTQKGSNFQKHLIDAGLALQANLSYQTQKYVGPIQIILVPNPQKVKEAIAQLETEIDQFDSDDYFTDEQLETAKRMLTIQGKYAQEKTSSFVHTLTFWWASASLDYYANYFDNIQKVTRQDIVDYVHQYIQNQPNVTGILVSPKMKSMLNIDLATFQPINTTTK